MKKLIALLFVIVLSVSMVGCAGSPKPNSDSQRINHTPKEFNYITFHYIPKDYTLYNESFKASRNYSNNVNSLDYLARIDNGPRVIMDPYYKTFVQYHADNKSHEGRNLVDEFENSIYIRDSLNGHWALYLSSPPITKFVLSYFVDEFTIIMMPTDGNIVGYVSLTAHYTYCYSYDRKSHESLIQDISEIADGISKSSLDQEVFNKRCDQEQLQ